MTASYSLNWKSCCRFVSESYDDDETREIGKKEEIEDLAPSFLVACSRIEFMVACPFAYNEFPLE